ncbi:hypothetical protein [Pseudidiomarina aestuarii]|uniref:hypothetical protein n=1 Tax=Pseudidiomarina aestuarii TaxID=624146 RepID=UPI003A970C4D
MMTRSPYVAAAFQKSRRAFVVIVLAGQSAKSINTVCYAIPAQMHSRPTVVALYASE